MNENPYDMLQALIQDDLELLLKERAMATV